jgi:hypothetical protein
MLTAMTSGNEKNELPMMLRVVEFHNGALLCVLEQCGDFVCRKDDPVRPEMYIATRVDNDVPSADSTPQWRKDADRIGDELNFFVDTHAGQTQNEHSMRRDSLRHMLQMLMITDEPDLSADEDRRRFEIELRWTFDIQFRKLFTCRCTPGIDVVMRSEVCTHLLRRFQ